MKKLILSLFGMMALSSVSAQSLEKMNWFNEPESWEIKDSKTMTMFVTPQSDYWRISHYGFTVDDAPFYYATYGGEFEAKVKVSGEYKTRFDQAGIMLRIDHENYNLSMASTILVQWLLIRHPTGVSLLLTNLFLISGLRL